MIMKKEKGGSTKPEKMAVKTFLYHFMRITNNKNLGRRFCFILGAGASKQSGIPTGAELVKDWVKELHETYDEEDLKQWADDNKIKDLESGEAAKYYSQIYDKRFEIDPQEGYGALENIMEGKEPSFGYSVLAQILANTDHNVVITTNFDSLVEDALFIYTQKKPLVAGHEALASFIRPIMRRPLIAKIHRDILLAPISDSQETSRLADGWKKSLTSLFKFYKPVVIGYGGNDGSLMGFLKSLEPIDGGMFWCYRENDGEPVEEILQLVIKHKGYIIPIVGFDELMLQINEKLGYSLLDESIVDIAKRKAEKYRGQVEKTQKNLNETPKAFEAKAALKSMRERQKRNWWAIELMAQAEEDLDKKEEIYKQGLAELPDSAELLVGYAILLHFIKKDYYKAEELYKKAMELDPENAIITSNYAVFLNDVRKDNDKAEEFYKKALELDPENAINMGNYANFLMTIRGEYEKAEELFNKALELDPKNANNTGKYATFLMTIRKEYDKAEKLFNKALELDPKNASNTGKYATFLMTIRKEYDKAEEFYKKALELDPENAINMDNYALFLNNVRKENDKAEELYKKAVELDPKDANLTGNYASFLMVIKKDYDKAEELYKRAMGLDPKNASYKGNYAIFLKEIRKDNKKAEEFYKNALELDPENAINMGNYANFLMTMREEYEKAEELFKKALELDPKNASNTGKYANFLMTIRKEYDKAEKLYKKSLELDPKNAINTGNYALFLNEVRKDYDEAVKFYKKALGLDPEDANLTGNYAKMLLTSGNESEGEKYLEKAFSLNPTGEDTLLELWFYRYAHFPNKHEHAYEEIMKLLKKGARSLGWDFSGNIERAKKDGHPNIDRLEKLAKVISEDAPIDILEERGNQ
jgi:tetratricopeptide (TPR) repeat protein